VRSWFVYVVRLDAAIDRDAVMGDAGPRGRMQAVPARRAPAAVLPEPRARPGEFPVAEAIARSTLALPFHTRLAPEDQAYVAACLADVLG
jgi:dTDP-4-amino-4,6-dideoxygalactose transaminase